MGFHLKITIISGQQLPKPTNLRSEVVDPYVQITVHGMENDGFSYNTRVVGKRCSAVLLSAGLLREETSHVRLPPVVHRE